MCGTPKCRPRGKQVLNSDAGITKENITATTGKGGGIPALIIGMIIIAVGLSFFLSQVYGVSIRWWSTIVIIIGVWLIVRAVM